MKRSPNHQIKQERGQTKAAGGDFMDKLHAYRDLHAHAFFSSLGRLFGSPFTSLLTIGVLSIALSLAASFYLLVANLQQLTGNVEISKQISLFLNVDVSEASAQKLADYIKKNPDVRQVKLIGKDQALKEFQQFGSFGKAIDILEENPLPIVLEVLPRHALTRQQELENLLHQLQRSSEVDFAQMDWQWLERLQSIVSVAQQGMKVVSVLLSLGVLFITGNTIRLELHHRHDEVVIAKLVGATNAFIKRPFLY
ncbi:MAG: cell division protein FtsX, partial [Gammaproteobacteria bacterium]